MSGAPFACRPEASLGRVVAESDSNVRSAFQRDRDRILHCTAFRRLEYKTQVFANFEGDHFRTRLTHTLEVAQIARTLARPLGVDEDLAEAVALAHDLGHSPFGHAGEAALDKSLADFGGFDHNLQTFRILTRLEQRYALFDGLNLTFETLEGVIKHNGPVVAAPRLVRDHPLATAVDLSLQAPLEAQVAGIADDVLRHLHLRRGEGHLLPAGAAKAAAAAKWDGKTTFECGGNDIVALNGVTATAGVKAAGNCQLTMTGVNITAPVAIEAGANAKVINDLAGASPRRRARSSPPEAQESTSSGPR